MKAYRWYEPSLWLLLISAPSPLLRSDHRRRARLFSLILFVILVTGIIINSLTVPGSEQFFALLACNICLSFAYLASRTRHYKLASSASVFLLWALTIVTVGINAAKNRYEDVTVTDPVNWMFLPALYCVCAVFLSRTGTVAIVLTDFVGCLVLPFVVNTSFFAVRKFLFYHCVMNVLLLLASIIHFRDKLQLYYSAQGISDPEAHMESGLGRWLVRPHDTVSDRILRRRARILSLCLLVLIPANILWCISEFKMNGDSSVIGLSAAYLVTITILYAMSRSPLCRWAFRATLAAFLLFPYFFSFCPSTIPEGAVFANLLANSAAAVLGIALLAGEDLITLAAIIFFPTIYSPLFPPHIAMSVMLLVAALISRDEHEELVSAGDTPTELPEDDAAHQQKMYFCGRFTYLQAARYSFLGGFFCCFILGMAPLIAVLDSSQPHPVYSKASITSEAAANYRMFVTVGHCPSELPQQYAVIGSASRLYFTYDGSLVENFVNVINVRVEPTLGTLQMVSVTLGNGDWKLGQSETCEIANLQVLDVATGTSVATSILPPLDSASSSTTQSRHFALQASSSSSQASSQSANNCGILSASRNSFGSPAVSCSVLQQVQSATAALVCFFQTCSNQGKCVAVRADNSDGAATGSLLQTLLPNYNPVCVCNDGFTGAKCERTWKDVCPVLAIRTCDGSCNLVTDPSQGQMNQLFPRDSSPQYADSVSAVINPVSSRLISTQYITGKRALWSLYSDEQTVLANAFLNYVLDDIADFGGGYSAANSYTLAGDNNPSPFVIYRKPYKGGLITRDNFANPSVCASSSCSCEPTTCAKNNQTMLYPRYYSNAQTPSFDGSATYGAGSGLCTQWQASSGGELPFGKDRLLPKNVNSLPLASGKYSPSSMFVTGDYRGNANPLTLALHTMVMRNHNRIVGSLKTCMQKPNIPSSVLFNSARLVNVAQLHQILQELLDSFGFDASEATQCPPENDALIVSLETTLFANWFDGRPDQVATASGCEGVTLSPALDVAYDTNFFETQGIDKIVQGALRQPIRPGIASTWGDFDGTKLGRPEKRTDIVASVIELARDLGLGTYNQIRTAYCLQPVTCGQDASSFSSDVCGFYGGDASKIELAVGMLFDEGDLARRIVLGAFTRLLSNDRFSRELFQQNLGASTALDSLTSSIGLDRSGRECVQKELQNLDTWTLKTLIKYTTNVVNVQDSAFLMSSGDNWNLCQGNSDVMIAAVTTDSPTPSPTPVPTGPYCPNTRYAYDGSCNVYNNKNLNLSPVAAPDTTLPGTASLSNVLFGATSNADRGRSKLTALAIAYSRFFLSDVLEVSEANQTSTQVAGCYTNGVYGKIASGAKNYQTPVMDLSPIFGATNVINDQLKDPSGPARLQFVKITAQQSLSTNNAELAAYKMIGRNGQFVYLSGSTNSNVDHYSIYIHSRFFWLHTKFANLLIQDYGSGTVDQLTVFESARLFVVMVAETIARDLAAQLGTLPSSAAFDFTNGIPPEFLLMPFIDRFPTNLYVYNDTTRSDDFAATSFCGLPTRTYASTLYDITLVNGVETTTNYATNSDYLAWVGYSSMYTLARNGGALANATRCATSWVGINSAGPYDPIAAVIARGRDFVFPTCAAYRASYGLAPVTFSDFGNDAFAKLFAAQYGNNFSKVELSVCLLLDADLRDKMMGSLILGVLNLQNSLPYCNGATPNFDNTVVANLVSYNAPTPGGAGGPRSGSQLQNIANALCKSNPKLDLRALVMQKQLNLADSTVSMQPSPDTFVDRFIVCTTANPFLNPSSKFTNTRLLVKEGSGNICDWSTRDNTGGFLANAPRCLQTTTSTGAFRRCFCQARDGCFDRGIVANANSCNCDRGYFREAQANVMCERSSLPQTQHVADQFGSNTTTDGNNLVCSATYSSNPPTSTASASLSTTYCNSSTCSFQEGHYLYGGCNNAANADLGRVGAALGRIAPANYPNGILFQPDGTAYGPSFTSAFPANATALAQNIVFRGMGKFLLDDVLSATTTYFNESGLRTASDASNPAQFKNLATSWIDLSVIFPQPAPYASTSYQNSVGTLGSYANSVTDDTEKIMRTLWTQRYNQIWQQFYSYSYCYSGSTNICDKAATGRCVRELVLVELRSVVREFLTEAKLLFPGQASFNRDDTIVAPVELAAARLFDLHFAAPVQTACNNLNNYQTDQLSGCLNSAHTVPLQVQRNLSGLDTNVTAYVNTVKSFGVGSLNSYLSRLNAPQVNYSVQSDNLLRDLRGSAAEYAINFGILETILAQDSRADSANNTCYTNLQFGNSMQASTASMLAAVSSFLNAASNRTLCTLLQDMGSSAISSSQLHPRMFLVQTATGGC